MPLPRGRRLHPELTRPLLDAWSMTSLWRHEGRPEVAPWLRGWEKDDDPQTSVVVAKTPSLCPGWRGDDRSVLDGGGVLPSSTRPRDRKARSSVEPRVRLDAQAGGTSRQASSWATTSAIGCHEIVVIAIDRVGEHRAHLTLRELRLLAAPAKSLQKDELRQRNRRKGEWRERHSGRRNPGCGPPIRRRARWNAGRDVQHHGIDGRRG